MIIDTCEILREEIENIIAAIFETKKEHNIRYSAEHIVEYDIFSVWADYLYFLRGVLNRWDDCISLLKKILSDVSNMISEQGGSTAKVTLFCDSLDKYSYRFEDFIVSFARLGESPMQNEIERHLSNALKKRLQANQYNKNDIEGLFWKINVLRNRAAHASEGAYTQYNGLSARWMSFSSKIQGVRYDEGHFIMNTMLIDLSKSAYIKNLIQKELIDGNSDKSVMELLFTQNSPKGHGKNKPQVLFPDGFPFFDLNEGFLLLSVDILKYIKNQLYIILDAMTAAG